MLRSYAVCLDAEEHSRPPTSYGAFADIAVSQMLHDRHHDARGCQSAFVLSGA